MVRFTDWVRDNLVKKQFKPSSLRKIITSLEGRIVSDLWTDHFDY